MLNFEYNILESAFQLMVQLIAMRRLFILYFPLINPYVQNKSGPSFLNTRVPTLVFFV